MTTFRFGEYRVRPIGEQDRQYLTECIERDKYHRGKITADFFLKVCPGRDSWAVEDDNGKVVFYFRTDAIIRFAIQFTDSESLSNKRTNALAMMEGLAWLSGILRQNNFHEIITDADSPELQRFTKRHLGFKDAPGQLSLALGTIEPVRMPPRSVGVTPTPELERVG